MSDQFAEWDKLVKALETTVTVEGGYQRYKARRLRAERQAAARKAKETRARKRAEAKLG